MSRKRSWTSSADLTYNLLTMIQFDHWLLPSASPVCSLMSHDDVDHNPETCTSCVQPVIAGSRFAKDLQSQYVEVRPNGSAKHHGITFWLNYNKLIEVQGSSPQVRRFHSDWWYVLDDRSHAAVLFLGNLDFPEVPVIKPYVDYILDRARRPLSAILLPSYASVSAGLHRVPDGEDHFALQKSIENVVTSLKVKRKDLRFGGLPHPVEASWSDYQFQRFPIKRVT